MSMLCRSVRWGLRATVLIMAIMAAVARADDAGATISVAHARSLFLLRCAGCHQIDGAGHPQVGVPSMRNTLGYFPASAAGRAFLVQVPGARNAAITDAELAALTNWELQSFSKAQLPPDFIAYSEQEVRQSRANPPLDIAASRAAILRDLQEKGVLPHEAYQRLTGTH